MHSSDERVCPIERSCRHYMYKCHAQLRLCFSMRRTRMLFIRAMWYGDIKNALITCFQIFCFVQKKHSGSKYIHFPIIERQRNALNLFGSIYNKKMLLINFPMWWWCWLEKQNNSGDTTAPLRRWKRRRKRVKVSERVTSLFHSLWLDALFFCLTS